MSSKKVLDRSKDLIIINEIKYYIHHLDGKNRKILVADLSTDDLYKEIARKIKENLILDCQPTGKRKHLYCIIDFF